MLHIGIANTNVCTCDSPTRRAFVQAGACSVLGLSLAQLLRLRAENQPVQTRSARSVILLWLWGGPSQLDTWDPKPRAPLEYRGPFAAIPTRTPGVRIGELFPRIANLTNRVSILRSLHTTSNDHGSGGHRRFDGQRRRRRGFERPSVAGVAAPRHRRGCRASARFDRTVSAVHGHRRAVAPGTGGQSSANRVARSAVCTIRFGSNTTLNTVRAFPHCNCRTTSHRIALSIGKNCCMPSIKRPAISIGCARRARSTIIARKPLPC